MNSDPRWERSHERYKLMEEMRKKKAKEKSGKKLSFTAMFERMKELYREAAYNAMKTWHVDPGESYSRAASIALDIHKLGSDIAVKVDRVDEWNAFVRNTYRFHNAPKV